MDIIDNKYNELSLEEKIDIHEKYLHSNNQDELKEKLEKIIFRLKPPTPEEFLDPKNKWITKPLRESIYDHVAKDFCEILNEEKKYNQVCEYGAQRLGKSFLSRMLITYTIVYIHCLRHPQLYFGLSPLTNLSIYIMCFNAEKVKQILLKPIYNFLEASPRFKRIKFQDKVKEEQQKIGLETIVWSKASTFGEITLDSGLTINLGVDFMSFIGSDMIQLYISELAFFIEKNGATHDEIFKIYTDGIDRIKATVGSNYLGFVYLDTSANTTENPIEKYILETLRFQKKVFFQQQSRWEARPYLYPEWLKTGETFNFFIGDNTSPPKIIENEDLLKTLDPTKVIKVPIDLIDEFERDPIGATKNIAGRPTQLENKFIPNFKLIKNIFNNDSLKTIESSLIAESSVMPEKLLWNIIKQRLFFKYGENNYIIYRAPKEPRYIGIDLAHAVQGDVQGFSLLHKEWDSEKSLPVYVVDFCFAVRSIKTAINLEAISYLIMDLVTEGNLGIKGVFVDSFQSQSLIQFLERKNINAVKQSVDKTISPYQFLLTCLSNELLKSGPNIYLKNNLNALVRVYNTDKGTEKIDHIQGKTNNDYDGDFINSTCGINAKDVSDAVCQALWGAKQDEFIPFTEYYTENERVNKTDKSKEMFIKDSRDRLNPIFFKKTITNK